MQMTNEGRFEIHDLEGVFTRISERLENKFVSIFSKETIERYVKESYALLAERARVTVYLPLLTERFTRERLTALAQSEVKIAKDKPEILFICVHNAGRSQMAAALAIQISGGAVSARSAGSAPSDSIPAAVHEAMEEIGLNLVEAFPKPLTDEVVRAADIVITMGCGDACPIYPGKRYEDWDLADPAELDAAGVVSVRNDIEARIRLTLTFMQNNVASGL
jgi:arsenate reductase (thioredoxin)